MSSIVHIEDGKKKLVWDFHRLARLGVHLIKYKYGGIIVQSSSESSLVSDVKVKQDLDPTMIELKKAVF